MIAIKLLYHRAEVLCFSIDFLDDVVEMIAEQRDEESGFTTLKRHLSSLFLADHTLAFQLFILEVQLWDLLQNPKDLSVQLLVAVMLDEFLVDDLLGHDSQDLVVE